MTPYLSVCAIYRDEAPYMREWIEFHRLVGVERFFLYDNGSVDEHEEVLRPYVASGVASVQDWQIFPGQIPAYQDCIERHRDDSRWIAFIDLDEFLFSPTLRPLPEVLVDYEDAPAVGVNRYGFGPSGHVTKPDGLVIESYLHRADELRRLQMIKSVVDPRRTVRCEHSHYFTYADGALAVTENHEPIEGWHAEQPSFERLQINHYVTKSHEEYRVRWARPRPHTGIPRQREGRDEPNFGKIEFNHRTHEDTITAYVPALRAALSGVAAE
jgi:hypothetical protein